MAGQIVAYIRVSSAEQNEARQVEALTGALRLFVDKQSGNSADRPALTEMLAYVRDGDTVRISSMDRLARNLDDLRSIVKTLTSKGVRVEFLKEGQTFTGEDSPMSNLLLSLLGAVAEFERSLIRERQAEGIALAKDRGVYKGRAARLTPEQVAEARQRVAEGVPKAAVAREAGVSRQTLYAALSGTGPYATSAPAA